MISFPLNQYQNETLERKFNLLTPKKQLLVTVLQLKF